MNNVQFGTERRADAAHLRAASAIARRALAAGRHPFGALLVGPDHETVLIEQGNVVDCWKNRDAG